MRSRWHRRRAFQISSNPNEKQALTVLGDAIPDCVQDRVANPVTSVSQIRGGVISNVPPTNGEHSWNVLHHDSERLPKCGRLQKSNVELVAGIGGVALIGQAVQLRSPDAGKALTGRATNQDVWSTTDRKTLEIELVFNVSLVARQRVRRGVRLEASEVLGVRSCRRFIDVNCAENLAPGGVKPKAEPACATEQVDDAEAPWITGWH
jgi:hypothetical protein